MSDELRGTDLRLQARSSQNKRLVKLTVHSPCCILYMHVFIKGVLNGKCLLCMNQSMGDFDGLHSHGKNLYTPTWINKEWMNKEQLSC